MKARYKPTDRRTHDICRVSATVAFKTWYFVDDRDSGQACHARVFVGDLRCVKRAPLLDRRRLSPKVRTRMISEVSEFGGRTHTAQLKTVEDQLSEQHCVDDLHEQTLSSLPEVKVKWDQEQGWRPTFHP